MLRVMPAAAWRSVQARAMHDGARGGGVCACRSARTLALPLLLAVLALALPGAPASFVTPYQMVIMQQPANATGGAPFAQQPVVQIRDALGAVVTSIPDDTLVYVAVDSNPATYANLKRTEEQRIVLRADAPLTAGEFTLEFMGSRTDPLPFDAAASAMKEALQRLDTMGVVYVTRTGLLPADGAVFGFAWTVTFVWGWGDRPLLQPAWAGAGCDDCAPLSAPFAADPPQQVAATELLRGMYHTAEMTLTAGEARFRGLAIDLLGEGYTLRFVSFGMGYELGLQVASQPFDVVAGPPEQLYVLVQPGTATGGLPFAPQPVVALADAGGNPVPGAVNYGTVTASIEDNPGNGTLGPPGAVTVDFVDGVATFVGLRIDHAGLTYRLRFSTDSVLLFPNYVLSVAFTVAVGPAATLEVSRQPAGARGGLPFAVQPQLLLRDAGGNVLVLDSSTRVLVAVEQNPVGGHLSRVEVQHITVAAAGDNATSTGQFALYYTPSAEEAALGVVGGVTAPLPVLASAAEVRAALQSLPALYRVSVTVEAAPGPDPLPRTWTVSFITSRGDVPLLTPWLPSAPNTPGSYSGSSGMGQSGTCVTCAPFGEDVVVSVREVAQGCDSALTCRDPVTLEVWDMAAFAVAGEVTYAGLRLDRAGFRYTLAFTTETRPPVTAVSEPFDVLLGNPTFLHVDQAPAGVWAGGQPFETQPLLSLRDAGRNVITTDSDSLVAVSLLQPAPDARNATLLGQLSLPLDLGLAAFRDLRLDARGDGHVLRFATDVGALFVDVVVDVQPSVEFLLSPQPDGRPGDRFGAAVAVDGDMAVVGAPHSARSVTEVQVLSASGSAPALLGEVQRVTTAAMPRPAVQAVRMTRDNDSVPWGHAAFTASWGGQGPTQPLFPHSAASLLRYALEQAAPAAGPLSVSRQLLTDGTGVEWRVTFLTLRGHVPLLSVAEAGSAQAGVQVQAQVVQPSTVLAGTYRLAAFGLLTRHIPANASADEVGEAVADDLGASVAHVHVTTPDEQGGRSWTITFAATLDSYDLPQLEADGGGLEGYGACVSVVTVRDGEAPISGEFALAFDGQGPTSSIPVNASAAEVQAALEALPTIDAVTVTRPPTAPWLAAGRVDAAMWVITFEATRRWTEYGFVPDLPRNLPPLQVLAAGVRGTDASVTVRYVYGQPASPPWAPQRAGSAGSDVGAAYVFARAGETWRRVAMLMPREAGAAFQVGWSVAVHENVIALGAPYASDQGVHETQRLSCRADAGAFTLAFRGATTAAIPASATPAQLRAALEALPTVGAVEVATESSATVCGGVTVHTLITFLHPADGNLPALQATSAAPALTLGGSAAAAVLAVQDDVVAGTKRLQGAEAAAGNRTGCVFVYRRLDWGSQLGQEVPWTAQWEEEAALVPAREATDALGRPVAGAVGAADAMELGLAVAVTGDGMVAAGAPGAAAERGTVVVFRHEGASGWREVQRLVLPSGAAPGDRFGAAVAAHGTSLAVGAPGAAGGVGAVALFRRHPGRPLLLAGQVLAPPPALAAPGAHFGAAVALHTLALLVGAPGAVTVTSGGGAQATGAAVAFRRSAAWDDFLVSTAATLAPSAATALDRAGHAVALAGDSVALLAALPAFSGPLAPRRTVHTVRTYAGEGETLNGSFVLAWRQVPQPRPLNYTVLCYPGTNVACHPVHMNFRCLPCPPTPTGWYFPGTPRLPHHASARAVQRAVAELVGQPVAVTREGPSAQGGYTWFITFVAADGPVHPLRAASLLSGRGAGVEAAVAHEPVVGVPQRGAVHAFTLEDATWHEWQEQGMLRPNAPFHGERFGSSLHASADGVALVGSLNRDSFVSGVNAGAAFALDLRILDLSFSAKRMRVDEDAGRVVVSVTRCAPACRVPSATGPQGFTEVFASMVTGDQRTPDLVPPALLRADFPDAVPGSAVSSARCTPASEGLENCLWIDGVFDKFAQQDFAPIAPRLEFADSSSQRQQAVVITNDYVLETPDEFFNVRLHCAGFEPSPHGRLWATVTIEDDGDGGSGTQSFIEKMVSPDPTRAARFGAAVALAGSEAVVGEPQAPGTDSQGAVLRAAGAVHVFVEAAGLWHLQATLRAQQQVADAHFGSAVSISGNLLAVGVEGQAAVDVFERSAADAPWLFRARLTPPPIPGIPGVASTGSNMGMRGSVAAGPDYVAAGASGVEAVLVYRWSGVQQAWVHAQTLRSSRFRAVHAHDVQFRWRAEFGRSVAASGFTLLVGAPLQRVEGDAGSQALGPQHPEGATAWSGSGAVFAFHRRFGAQSGHPQQHMWAEHGMMRAQDAEPTSRFGMSVALDGDQAVIGATGSDALPNTTWDFESGTLAGWRLEGDAFLTQPTLGDNAALRPSYGTLLGPSRPQPAQPVGRYWVGTFENRRTEAAMPGDTQGDVPQGAMTSNVFVIGGSKISFLIGGGCQITLVYVTLLVDGHEQPLRATGRCEETMARVEWDVSRYRGRAAQIRVVDASSTRWGHINFDDVRFDWPIEGRDRDQTTSQASAAAPDAGAAYAFRRRASGSQDPCPDADQWPCVWEQQAKLQPRDKRRGDHFGCSVAVSDEAGLAVVAACRRDEEERSVVEAGAIYVFRRDRELRGALNALVRPPVWHRWDRGGLFAVDAGRGHWFGHVLAVSGFKALVGAPGDASFGAMSGAAYAVDISWGDVELRDHLVPVLERSEQLRAIISLQRVANLHRDVTLSYHVSDETARGISATDRDRCELLAPSQRNGQGCGDYLHMTGEVTLFAGQGETFLLVPITDDTCYERFKEFFQLRLGVPGGDALEGGHLSLRVRIDDDDFGRAPCPD